MEEGWEGCLSVPGMRGWVPRCRTAALLRASTRRASRFSREVEDFHARVVQHECDHLDGILYPMRIRDLTPVRLQRGAVSRAGPAGGGLGEDDRSRERGEKVRLDDISCRAAEGHDEGKGARSASPALGEELFALQDAMFGAKVNSVHGRAAGPRQRRQGRRDQARRRLPQPARRERGVVRRADRWRSASTISSGGCTATRRAWASSPSSTARTTRTCWWCACTTWRRRACGRSATATSPTSRSCSPSTAPSC